MPSTPPFKAMDDIPLDQDQMDRILQEAHVPWQSKAKESMGILPVRKIVKRTERGEWEDGLAVDDIPRESAVSCSFKWSSIFLTCTTSIGNSFKLKGVSGILGQGIELLADP
jgi:hypothetical protein